MLILPFHLESIRSSRLRGRSAALTVSVLYRMLIGMSRQAVIMASLSRYCSAYFSDDGGIYFAKALSFLSAALRPGLPSTTSNPGRPARHSLTARSDTPLADARQ